MKAANRKEEQNMTRSEYEHLQERLTKLLHKPTEYSGNRREAYKEGILAAKSMLHDEFNKYMKGE